MRKFLRKALQEGLFAFDPPREKEEEEDESEAGAAPGKEAEDGAESSAELRRRLLSLVVDDPARQPRLPVACEALVKRGVLLQVEGEGEGTRGTEQAPGEELGEEGERRWMQRRRVLMLVPERVGH